MNRRGIGPLVAACVALATCSAAPGVTADAVPPSWQSAGLQVGNIFTPCFDVTTPDVFYTSESHAAYANNYRTGVRTMIASHDYDACNPRTGGLFAKDTHSVRALRFSATDPAGVQVDHFPDYIAPDGSILYAWDDWGLFASTDDGLTWQERATQFAGMVGDIAPVDGAPASVYALVMPHPADKGKAAGGIPYALWFSGDAGVTWEQRYTDRLAFNPNVGSNGGNSGSVELVRHRGIAVSQTTIGLQITLPASGIHDVPREYRFSADGGRTFVDNSGLVPGRQDEYGDRYAYAEFTATSAGIIRIAFTAYKVATQISTDGGLTYAPLTLPFKPDMYPHQDPDLILVVAPEAPAFVLCTRQHEANDLYLSTDGGLTWRRLASRPTKDAEYRYSFSAARPPTLVALANVGVFFLDLTPDGAPASPVPSGPQMPTAPAGMAGFIRRLGDG